MVGKKFGRLLILSEYRSKTGRKMFNCKCECGNLTKVFASNILRKPANTKSCGCLRKEVTRETKTKHKGSGTHLFYVWCGMRDRCRNKNSTIFEHYGGKGIKICAEWEDFKSFRTWALLNGYKKNLTIERIDNNGNYTPNNCCWATMQVQVINKEYGHNTSGCRGVYFDKSENKWRGQVILNKKIAFSKRFDDFEEACVVTTQKRKEIHGAILKKYHK